MRLYQIYANIIKAIELASHQINTEPEIVKMAITEIGKISTPENIEIQTGFCHQKPYAMLIVPEKMFSKKRIELGDIMFVIKIFSNSLIIDQRALFFQVKYNDDFDRFRIEKHQLQFYSQIDEVIFKFGNNIYKNRQSPSIIWNKISKPYKFGDYFLIGKGKAYDVLLRFS